MKLKYGNITPSAIQAKLGLLHEKQEFIQLNTLGAINRLRQVKKNTSDVLAYGTYTAHKVLRYIQQNS
jgi:hypothetical protein